MSKAELVRRFRDDREGASLIEYSVLIGIILVVTIASITTVGTWVSGQWAALAAAL